jgi:hypothetical protein
LPPNPFICNHLTGWKSFAVGLAAVNPSTGQAGLLRRV